MDCAVGPPTLEEDDLWNGDGRKRREQTTMSIYTTIKSATTLWRRSAVQ